ncbi:MAG: SDR family oxidoreductase [Pseudomonadota bacterium]
MNNKKILIFGFGYTANFLAQKLKNTGFTITGTSRNSEKREYYSGFSYEIVDFTKPEVEKIIQDTTHILISTSQRLSDFDPVLENFTEIILNNTKKLEWIGYLSTTGVYGNHQGAWVDEETPVKPDGERTRKRIEAEQKWLEFGKNLNIPTNIFRLAGIYGEGRSVIEQLKEGKAQAIYKQNQVFSRIHVEDIANILIASINKPQGSNQGGNIYNVCDDEPAPAYEVMNYAAEILGLPKPEIIPYEKAHLSDMAKEFYSSNRRVSNKKIKEKLGVDLLYPTYREGIKAIIR